MEGPAMKDGELYGYHSGAPGEQSYTAGLHELLATAGVHFDRLGLGSLRTETTARNPRREPRQTDNLVAAYERALVAQAERHPRLVALDADLIKDCGLISFARRFPERFIECGIAEQDMVSTAAGLARRGVLPIVHSFACFLAARPNEQIYNQCSEGSKVIYVGSLAGLLPGGPGHSHQSVRDIAALAAVPGLVLAEPGCETEVDALLDVFVNDLSTSAYLRLVSVKWPLPFRYPAGHRPRLGQGWVVRDTGSSPPDALVFGYGPWLLSNAVDAAAALEQQSGTRLRVLNMPWLNRVDAEWLTAAIGDARLVITLDNHYLQGGQGEMLAATIAQMPSSPRVERVGVTRLPECGANDEVLAEHRLDVEGLIDSFRRALTAVIAPLSAVEA
jgi:transketolase